MTLPNFKVIDVNEFQTLLENDIDTVEVPMGDCTFGGIHFPAVPEKGKVELVPTNPKRTGRVGFGPFIDIENSVKVGRPEDHFYIDGKRLKLDLSKPRDRKKFALARIHPYVVGIGATRKVHVHDIERDATLETQKLSMVAEAILRVNNMTMEQKRDIAEIVLGTPMKDVSDAVVTKNLFDAAQNNPKSKVGQEHDNPGLLDILDDGNLEIRILIRKMRELGYLSFANRAWNYHSTPRSGAGEPIGLNENQVIAWLHNNEPVLLYVQQIVNGSVPVPSNPVVESGQGILAQIEDMNTQELPKKRGRKPAAKKTEG